MRITKKKLEFPKELKDKCNRYLSRKTLEITYFDGYMVKFAGTNISTISPHKILLKSKEKEVVILYYGEHLYDEELFEALRNNDAGDLVQEQVNANSLRAFVKELKANNDDEIPEWIVDFINVYEKTKIAVRKCS